MKLVALPSVLDSAMHVFVLVSLTLALVLSPSRAQTQQPVLFAISTANNQYSASTFLRDDIAGTLTLHQRRLDSIR
jgi:hypothetical protein